MYLDTSLQTYLDDLASGQPTPGGGSSAAISGAMGAALVSMVARLTLGKSDYASVQSEVEGILQQSEQLRDRFQHLIQADIDAYERLSACYKMPRSTPEEKEARSQAIQEQLVSAALVPLEIVDCAAELTLLCKRLAEIGNKNVLSDIGTASMQAFGAGNGASWMVRVNLHAMRDFTRVEALRKRQDGALKTVLTVSQQALKIVGERM